MSQLINGNKNYNKVKFDIITISYNILITITYTLYFESFISSYSSKATDPIVEICSVKQYQVMFQSTIHLNCCHYGTNNTEYRTCNENKVTSDVTAIVQIFTCHLSYWAYRNKVPLP